MEKEIKVKIFINDDKQNQLMKLLHMNIKHYRHQIQNWVGEK